MRPYAAEAIYRIRAGDQGARNALVGALAHERHGNSAELSLYRLGIHRLGQQILPQLVELLNHQCPKARIRTLRVLSNFHLSAAVPAIINRLCSGGDVERAFAINVLAGFGPNVNTPTEPIVQALGDPSPQVRRSAARALGKLEQGRKDVIKALINTLNDPDRNEQGAQVRELAVVSLGKLGPAAKEAVPHLVKVITNRDENSDYRASAIESLSYIGESSQEVVAQLIESLADPAVEQQAISALGQLGVASCPIIGGLQEKLSSPNPQTRVLAAALARLDDANREQFVHVLIDAAQDPNSEAQRIAIEELGKMGPKAKSAKPALTRLLDKQRSSYLRVAAAEALGKVDPMNDDAVRTLAELAAHCAFFHRDWVAHALGEIGRGSVLAQKTLRSLARAEGDGFISTRKAAIRALRSLE